MTERIRLNHRRAARLAAIQALYQAEVTGTPAARVIEEFEHHRLADLLEPFELDGPPPAVDRDWFRLLVKGAAARAPELDPMIASCLSEDWSLKRLGFLLRALLRAGAFELAARPDVPLRVVIDEYVELARGFLEGEEHTFVHAVLDRLARQLRPAPPAG